MPHIDAHSSCHILSGSLFNKLTNQSILPTVQFLSVQSPENIAFNPPRHAVSCLCPNHYWPWQQRAAALQGQLPNCKKGLLPMWILKICASRPMLSSPCSMSVTAKPYFHLLGHLPPSPQATAGPQANQTPRAQNLPVWSVFPFQAHPTRSTVARPLIR